MDSCRLPNQRQGKWERTFASPTPSSDGKLVFVTSEPGRLWLSISRGMKNGASMLRALWQVSLRFWLSFHDRSTRGASLSPVDPFRGPVGHLRRGRFRQGSMESGKRSDGVAECEHSYASPIAFRKGELNFLITHGNDYCIGHDPLTERNNGG